VNISILTDRKCEIISDPYPRYESQDTGIYMVMRVLAYVEFRLSAVVLSFCAPTIGGEMSEHLAATSGDPARPGSNRSTTRLDPIALLSECDTRFRTVILTSVYAKAGNRRDGARWAVEINCEFQVVLHVGLALE